MASHLDPVPDPESGTSPTGSGGQACPRPTVGDTTSIGSVIGRLEVVDSDGMVFVRRERDGIPVPVWHPLDRYAELRALDGRRVEVSGQLFVSKAGFGGDLAVQMEMCDVEVLREAPGPVPYIPDMTGGLTEREYLEQLRRRKSDVPAGQERRTRELELWRMDDATPTTYTVEEPK